MVRISIRGLTKRFGRLCVLDQVELTIDPGELFFLLGPSGCGKTTLLRHIAGFYRPDEGRIFFDDADVTTVPAHLRGASMMFQNYALWPHLNVAQNIAFGLEELRRPKHEIEDRVAEALEMVQLSGLGQRRISELSGGQQQRVALARALVIRPHCLLLDEPLSNLDTQLRREMRLEIRRLCKEAGLTAIYVTHDRDEALSMADRLAVMERGRLVQVGAPEEVYRHPATRMAAEFLGETNFIEGTVLNRIGVQTFEVATAFAHLRARTNELSWLPERGTQVLLSIRSEALSFAQAPHEANTFQGQLVDVTYLGAFVQYRLQVPEGPLLQITEAHPQQLRQPGARETWVHAAVEDVVMLPITP